MVRKDQLKALCSKLANHADEEVRELAREAWEAREREELLLRGIMDAGKVGMGIKHDCQVLEQVADVFTNYGETFCMDIDDPKTRGDA